MIRASKIWFDSGSSDHARWHGLEVITPAERERGPDLLARVRAARQPDFLFSFLLSPHALRRSCWRPPSRGAYNMHGSLLAENNRRAGVPVNWGPLLRGEDRNRRHLARDDGGARPMRAGIVDTASGCRSCRTILPAKSSARSTVRGRDDAAALASPGLVAGTAVFAARRMNPRQAISGGPKREPTGAAIRLAARVPPPCTNLVRAGGAGRIRGAFASANGLSLRVLPYDSGARLRTRPAQT